MANHLAFTAALLTSSLACSGCIAVWQSDHMIEASTDKAVIIDYDPLLIASDRVANTARSECRKFQRVAVLDHVRNGRTWTKIAKFRCDEEPSTLKGSIANLPFAVPNAGITYQSLPSPFPAATPPVATSQIAGLPAVPLVAAPQAAGPLAEPSQVGSVSFIDAIGPNWGVTHRQVHKAPVTRTKVAKTRAANLPAHALRSHAGPEHSLKASNLPVANLKGSLVS